MADDGFSDVADVTDEGYDFAPDPSSVGMDSGDNSEAYNSAVENQTQKQAYTTMRGATATNPFPESFFSQMFGAENVNYTNIIGSDRIAEINDLRYNQATGGMSNRTGANTGKPYQMGDYYIGQPTQMGTVKEVPQTGIMSVMDNLPYIGAISSVMGRNRGLPENDPRRIAMMEEQAKSANDPTVFDRTSDFVKSILGLDPKDSGASLAASPIGEGQMRVPDNRTFDAFGNVTGSSLDTTSGIGTINKEVTNNAVNNVVSDNMIQGPPNLIDKNVINLGLVGTPGYNISGKFDYPGTDRDSTSSYTKAGPDFVTEKFPTEDEVYQEFLKRMYAN